MADSETVLQSLINYMGTACELLLQILSVKKKKEKRNVILSQSVNKTSEWKYTQKGSVSLDLKLWILKNKSIHEKAANTTSALKKRLAIITLFCEGSG